MRFNLSLSSIEPSSARFSRLQCVVSLSELPATLPVHFHYAPAPPLRVRLSSLRRGSRASTDTSICETYLGRCDRALPGQHPYAITMSSTPSPVPNPGVATRQACKQLSDSREHARTLQSRRWFHRD